MKALLIMQAGAWAAFDRLASDARVIWRDRKGVAAVEFALILPLMLVLYIGTAEITTGLMANRKMTLVSRAVSDLVAQEDDTNGIDNATINNIFDAAAGIMSPFTATSLKMTVSSIRFVPNSSDPANLKAMTVWSIRKTAAATARPCGSNALTQVANTASATYTTMPSGLYQAGTVIVADVEYVYTPNLGGAFLSWSSTQSSLNMRHTTYMKPRTQDAIIYNHGGAPLATATVCNPAPPATWS